MALRVQSKDSQGIEKVMWGPLRIVTGFLFKDSKCALLL